MQAPVCRVVNPLDTVPHATDRSQGYRHTGVEKKLMGTTLHDGCDQKWLAMEGVYKREKGWQSPA